MSPATAPLCPNPSALLPHTGGMRLLSCVLGWSATQLAGRIDIEPSSYLVGTNGASGTLATEYLAQCSAALFTLLALSSQTVAQPRPGMLIASRALELTEPTFGVGALLGMVQAQSVLPEEHSMEPILVRFSGTLSTLNPSNPQDETMLRHAPGLPALPMADLRERADGSVVARAEFSVYLPTVETTELTGATNP